MKVTAIIVLLLLFTSCKQRTYHLEKVNNPEYRANTAFTGYENTSLPRFDSLKSKYQLDTIFHGETDELKRILLLRNWIRQQININDFGDPYPGNDHPQGILDAAVRGQGYHCGHYMVVQNAILNTYGYVTRCLGSGPGVKGRADGHHGMNEVWLNSYNKWFLSDAKFNHHFEKNAIPLSALEVREEFLKNGAAAVVIVKGPDRTAIETDVLADKAGVLRAHDRKWFAQWYTWLEWDNLSTRFSSWPGFQTKLNMYRDDYFAKNTWYWDGKPHWAYNTDQVNYVDEKTAIEWTPNTITSLVSINGENARIELSSFTPNFKEYQVKHGAGDWVKCDSILNVSLDKAREEYLFRVLNLAGVSGPQHKVVFTSD
jgi:hypothetical protein